MIACTDTSPPRDPPRGPPPETPATVQAPAQSTQATTAPPTPLPREATPATPTLEPSILHTLGPGRITSDPSRVLTLHHSGVIGRDVVVTVTFQTPQPWDNPAWYADFGGTEWDFGVVLRENGPSGKAEFIGLNKGGGRPWATLGHQYYTPGVGPRAARLQAPETFWHDTAAWAKPLDLTAGALNTLTVTVCGTIGLVAVNGVDIGKVDLRHNLDVGEVSLGAGYNSLIGISPLAQPWGPVDAKWVEFEVEVLSPAMTAEVERQIRAVSW